jgi:hypothetical protein
MFDGWDLRLSPHAHSVNRIAARFPARAPQGNAQSGFMKIKTAPAANCGLLHTQQSAKHINMAERSDGSSFVMSVLPNRPCAITSGTIGLIMQDLLQQLDLDYYRSALLNVARAELERLRQVRSAGTDFERWRKSPFGASPAAEGAASPEVVCAGPPYGGTGAARRE